MIVQSIDGNYYRNPIVDGGKWCLKVTEDGAFVQRKGPVTWRTARSGLKGGGVNCKYAGDEPENTAILEGRLVKVSVFRVSLLSAIPIPASHEGCLFMRPSETELEKYDESLLAWK